MTTELSNEQIVTNLLVSNQILKPITGFFKPDRAFSLGEYLSNIPPEIKSEIQPKTPSKYTFIDLQKKWL